MMHINDRKRCFHSNGVVRGVAIGNPSGPSQGESAAARIPLTSEAVPMTSIRTDQDLRRALEGLSPERQRQLGGHFVQSVLHLCQEPRVDRAVATAIDPKSSPADLQDAFIAAKSYARKTYTACGTDAQWLEQADHFVAAAAAAALLPPEMAGESYNWAWKAAIQARMAKNCEMMEREEGEVDNEAQRQYRIATELLNL